MSENRSLDFAKYESMPTEELEEILRLHFNAPDGEEIDSDLVLYVMEVLAKRRNSSENPGKSAEQAFESFKKNYLPEEIKEETSPKVRPMRWLWMAASAAAIALVLFTVVPNRAEAETFWEWLSRWTSDIVEFFSPYDNDGRLLEYEFQTDNAGLQQLYDVVLDMGITEPVVPMWLPEGCELLELEQINTSKKRGVQASFSIGDGELVYQIDYYNAEYLHTYQKNDVVIKEFEIFGIVHSVLSNTDGWVVLWNRDNIECFLTVDCQEDTLNKILESIYVVEDST